MWLFPGLSNFQTVLQANSYSKQWEIIFCRFCTFDTTAPFGDLFDYATIIQNLFYIKETVPQHRNLLWKLRLDFQITYFCSSRNLIFILFDTCWQKFSTAFTACCLIHDSPPHPQVTQPYSPHLKLQLTTVICGHLNNLLRLLSAKSAVGWLQVHPGSGVSCWKNTQGPLPVLNEVDCGEVAGN